MPLLLHLLLDESARRRPDHPAIEELTGHTASYSYVAEQSDRLRDCLVHLGVAPGDRVGICLKKSIDAIVSMFGVLKTGAAYVPVDAGAPASRNGYIFSDCRVKALIVEAQLAEALQAVMTEHGCDPALLVTDGSGGGRPLEGALTSCIEEAPETETVMPDPDVLAYILYTSGSTGRPKGVMVSHRAARVFVDWCSETFEPHDEDRFSSHAPFHFDLSIHDIYVPIKHGATVVLIDHALGRDPARLAPTIAEKHLTIWYSTPSILSLLTEYGSLPDRDYSALRIVLFAGEVFPVQRLHALMRQIPSARYYNLYGPTETNVCTFHEIPSAIREDRTEPYPIGAACSSFLARVVDATGEDVEPGAEGELCLSGSGVMSGYWNLDEQTATAFLVDEEGRTWYRSGDIVVEAEPGEYVYRGRRDRMVKRRGYRVELGEIESSLCQHPSIRQAAVIAQDGDDGMVIKAFISTVDGSRPSMLKLKRHCSECLPLYMIPDQFAVHDTLPTTSTDKIDYQALRGLD